MNIVKLEKNWKLLFRIWDLGFRFGLGLVIKLFSNKQARNRNRNCYLSLGFSSNNGRDMETGI